MLFCGVSAALLLLVDELPEDGVGGDDPGDGDGEAPPHGHVGDAPPTQQDPAHRLARERLRQHVRDVPG